MQHHQIRQGEISCLSRHCYQNPKETPVKAVPRKGIPVKAGFVRITLTSMPWHLCRTDLEKENGDISFCVEHTSKGSFEISSRVVNMLRHSPELRVSDGAIPWTTLMYQSRGSERTATWTFDDWKTCLGTGTSKIRLKCCLNENNQIQYMRSVQGHSGAKIIIQDCKTMCLSFTDGRITFITPDHRIITSPFEKELVLIAGGLGFRDGRPTCFFTAVDPMVATMFTPRCEANEPIKLPYN